MTHYKAIIMGGGPSGHSAAVRISQLGGKVALVERDLYRRDLHQLGLHPQQINDRISQDRKNCG